MPNPEWEIDWGTDAWHLANVSGRFTSDNDVAARLARCSCRECCDVFTAVEVAAYRTNRAMDDGNWEESDRETLFSGFLDSETTYRIGLAERRLAERREEEERRQREQERRAEVEAARERIRIAREQEQRRTCSECYSVNTVDCTPTRISGLMRNLCANCAARLIRCHCCGYSVMHGNTTAVTRYGDRRVCRACRDTDYARCTECEAWYDATIDLQCCEARRSRFAIDYGDYGHDSDCDSDCDYNHRADDDEDYDDSDGATIHDYSHRPSPVFYGKDGIIRTFYGVELELAMKNDRYQMARMAYNLFPDDLIYIKTDSSISYGWELVTHPMSATYALTGVNWESALSALAANSARADESTGMHIHISKKGFSGPDHDYRWLMFWHRNEEPLTVMARRDPSQWGRFSNEERKRAKDVATKKDTNRGRYSAINSQPSRTYEVRIFASSTDPAEVTGSIALVAATVEYTRQLRASDILKRKGWEWDSFIEWLEDDAQSLYAPALNLWRTLAAVEAVKPMRRRRDSSDTSASIF